MICPKCGYAYRDDWGSCADPCWHDRKAWEAAGFAWDQEMQKCETGSSSQVITPNFSVFSHIGSLLRFFRFGFSYCHWSSESANKKFNPSRQQGK